MLLNAKKSGLETTNTPFSVSTLRYWHSVHSLRWGLAMNIYSYMYTHIQLRNRKNLVMCRHWIEGNTSHSLDRRLQGCWRNLARGNLHYIFSTFISMQHCFICRLGCLRNFVSSKFRIFRMFFLISYTIWKWQQFRENNRNFALTGVRIESIDSVQIYQFSIAKIMTFFLDTVKALSSVTFWTLSIFFDLK